MMEDTSLSLVVDQRFIREKLTSWDSKESANAPLTEKQIESFMEINHLSTFNSLPLELPVDDVMSNLTPVSSFKDDEKLVNQIEKFGVIGNVQQFYSWFDQIGSSIEEEGKKNQKLFLHKLEKYNDECDQILDEVMQAMSYLLELQEKYISVSTRTNSIHDACEHLLAEQTKLINTADCINNKLAYFNELERISSKLGSPAFSVTNDSFIPLLSRLDECIAYLNKNPQYKEGAVYLAKFTQCLSRATSLIRTHVFNIFQNATQLVMPQHKDVSGVSDDAFTLFYGKFRANAPRVKSLMEQVEARVDKSPEYEQLLTDCQQFYFQQRITLLSPSVTNAVRDLASRHARDHCSLVRSGCAFMVHVCEDEYQLFYNFFSQHTPALVETMESLTNTLYDVLRPLIIKINHLETLSELCAILKIEMLEEHVLNHPQQLSAFEKVITQMLQDVQERLVYRTSIFIETEIAKYAPAAGDLAYPDKLIMMENIAGSLRKAKRPVRTHSRTSSTSSTASAEVAQINAEAEETERFVAVPLAEPLSGGGNMPMSPADLHGMWYPTVRRTLVCLSKLYRCLDKTTFQGLSQEAISKCIYSLIFASIEISKREAGSGFDGDLFLIKHLLILREQIAPFHVEFTVKEMSLDFSKIKGAAMGLMTSKGKVFALNSTNSILKFLLEGTPQVTETYVDSKKQVDGQLKKSCEDFIKNVVDRLCGPLKDYINKVNMIVELVKTEGLDNLCLKEQPFATANAVNEVIMKVYKNLKAPKLEVQRTMSLYLANKDTEYILFRPIKSNIQNSYQQFCKILEKHYNEEDQQIIAAPSIEQINLLLGRTQSLTA